MRQADPMAAAQGYTPRDFAPLDPWELGGVSFKVYSIALQGSHRTLSLEVAARDFVVETLPDLIAREGDAKGVGYIILHEGEDANWLLMHWWAHGEICCQSLASADKGSVVFRSLDVRPLMACVWELQIINFETHAFIDTMLVRGETADAYLATQLSEGRY
ncbi:hypothetical protein [Qingshengfaniella alkalisoli]|uniref:Uncharacterized protein n=1 Tax=Qingshengfaniella alkalisoli TaxID=2599296 RepID=A0A5B8IUQ4_9RHOB|nr:hypothetical protein [Qingshengfaniella alkalisoli]QDY68178.1 hypothetical protein FPZ52_00045 [Qingshengfaniella alkalisoli]